MLLAKAPMLDEYFRVGLQPQEEEGAEEGQAGAGADGFLTSLPDLLPNYTPSPEAIPLFLLRLATEVGCRLCGACGACGYTLQPWRGVSHKLTVF